MENSGLSLGCCEEEKIYASQLDSAHGATAWGSNQTNLSELNNLSTITKDHQVVSTTTKIIERAGIKENTLPNGKIKHRTDENGLINHVLPDGLLGPNGEEEYDCCTLNSVSCNPDCSHNESDTGILSCQSGVEEIKSSRDHDDNPSNRQEVMDSVNKQLNNLNISKDNTSTVAISSGPETAVVDDACANTVATESQLEYRVYECELQMADIMRLITKDLSEPYSIYTYRYFIHNWPKLCFLCMDGSKCVGAIVCKLDIHQGVIRRGYIAMLAVDAEYRRRKIGSNLVLKAIRAMLADGCDEVVLETEITNKAALKLYENLGFVRDKRLFRYYLNGVDALRLKLWLK
ncbi:N-alpha-acetyltransferase 30 [Octopus bimaculoides]|uniref:N-terminal methionine N(alpha)-acetyltransferase NatC n=1 Tax=Octopus bimaculoides TaxID=37653 RepID=A0A0L8I9X5_OCTBM|nr:N-alpha-acetyltransferase 30 [Octopus bimaculoides]|eukprot:XP_014783727.1 PREDICTED: N-alpha-acetyltransferase 30-like [Octopus bimaculoides]